MKLLIGLLIGGALTISFTAMANEVHYGNTTGSGLPRAYVAAHPELFPDSGLNADGTSKVTLVMTGDGGSGGGGMMGASDYHSKKDQATYEVDGYERLPSGRYVKVYKRFSK